MSEREMKRWEVQLGRTIHQACTYSVAAFTAEGACKIAIGLADRNGTWRDTNDPVSATFVDAIGPDDGGAWAKGYGPAAVPRPFTQEGMLFGLPWTPAGHADPEAGTYLVEFVSPDIGAGVAYGAFEYAPNAPERGWWLDTMTFERAPIEAVRICPYPTPDDGPRAFQLPPAVSADDVAVLLATIRDLLSFHPWKETALYGQGERLARIVRSLDPTEEELEAFACEEFRTTAPGLFAAAENG